MPLPIPLLDRDKQIDDPWTVTDANGGIRTSERISDAGRAEHNDLGEHLLPAAEGAALLTFDGSYSMAWAKNIASITRLGVGLLEITLVNQMRTGQHIAAFYYPDDEGLSGAVQVSSTSTTVRIQIATQAGDPVDLGGLLVVFGERLNP